MTKSKLTLRLNPSAYDEPGTRYSPLGAAAVLAFLVATVGLALAAAGAVVALRDLFLGGSGSVSGSSSSSSSASSTTAALAVARVRTGVRQGLGLFLLRRMLRAGRVSQDLTGGSESN